MKRLFIGMGVMAALGVAVYLGLRAASPQPVRGGQAEVRGERVHDGGRAPGPSQLEPKSMVQTPAADAAPMAAPAGAGPMTQAGLPLSGPECIGKWLACSTDISTIANTILSGFPSLDPKDHLLAVSKLAPLVGDDRYAGLQHLALDRKTSTEAREFLYHDALSRSDAVKLPLLLVIMQQRDHPDAAAAHAVLVSQFGADLGVNFGQWQALIQEELKRQREVK